jgi:hypothetical protein
LLSWNLNVPKRVEYAAERVAFENVADKRRCQAEDQRDHADSSRSPEGSTCQEDSTNHQSSTSQESNGRKRWKGQVVWGEDNQGPGWEEEEEKEEQEVWFTIKVKPTPGACRAQFDCLEITCDGQSGTAQAEPAAPAPWLAD